MFVMATCVVFEVRTVLLNIIRRTDATTNVTLAGYHD
jgi:hypothetical protein